MEMFSEIRNKYYDHITELIYMMMDSKEGLTSSDIRSFFDARGCENFIFIKSLLNKNGSYNFHILKENKDGRYHLNIKSLLPIMPDILEKGWLKHAVSDPRINLFLDRPAIEKLEERLKDCEDYIKGNIELKGKGSSIPQIDRTMKHTMDLFIDAVTNGKMITYDYRTRENNILKDRKSIPYKIEYSLKLDRFYLISYSIDEKRPIKSIINNFSNIRLQAQGGLDCDAAEDSIKGKRADEEIFLEIRDTNNNSIERAFLTFSCFTREGSFDREKNIHHLKIYYYKFDEEDAIGRILSLGRAVRVVSPDSIRRKVAKRIEESLRVYSM